MKAIIAKQPGGPEVLEHCDVDDVQPQSNEIKIRVHAFGLNKAESYNRMGNHGAFSGTLALGIEAAGEVLEDPSGELKAGQKVVTAMGGMMFSRHGSYAEHICVLKSNVIAVDSDIDFIELATLPESFLTAWGALTHSLNLQQGETLLVRGATSTIGMASIIYAKWLGANVIATTRQQSRVAKLKLLGADNVIIDDGNIAEKTRILMPNGVDKAIELVGAKVLKDTLACVRKWGEAVFVGFVGGTPIVDQFHMMNDMPNTVKLSFFGSGIFGSEDLPLNTAPINALANALLQEKIPSILSKTFTIDNIQDAHRLLESNTAFGKIVVTR